MGSVKWDWAGCMNSVGVHFAVVFLLIVLCEHSGGGCTVGEGCMCSVCA